MKKKNQIPCRLVCVCIIPNDPYPMHRELALRVITVVGLLTVSKKGNIILRVTSSAKIVILFIIITICTT
jgi:hypothetical protein